MKSEINWIKDKINEEWVKGELKEFKKVKKKLIDKVLSWDKKIISKIRIIYTEDSKNITMETKKEDNKIRRVYKRNKKNQYFFITNL